MCGLLLELVVRVLKFFSEEEAGLRDDEVSYRNEGACCRYDEACCRYEGVCCRYDEACCRFEGVCCRYEGVGCRCLANSSWILLLSGVKQIPRYARNDKMGVVG